MTNPEGDAHFFRRNRYMPLTIDGNGESWTPEKAEQRLKNWDQPSPAEVLMNQFELHLHEQHRDMAIQKTATSSLPQDVKDLIETKIAALGPSGSVLVSCTGHERAGVGYTLSVEVRASADLAFPPAA